MEFKPEHDAIIAELAGEREAIMRKYRVRMTPTDRLLMPVDNMEAFGEAMDLNIAKLAALARIISRDTK